MKIQVHTDHNIEGHQALAERIAIVVENALGHFGDHITRVEVHLSDENSHKGGKEDKRCVIEARLERHQPIAVSHFAHTIDQAVDGAADKLTRAIDHALGKMHDQQIRRTDPPPPGKPPADDL